MGAGLAYPGTRFMPTRIAMAPPELRDMIVGAADIMHTPNMTGVHANFLRQSLLANGLDPGHLPPHDQFRPKRGKTRDGTAQKPVRETNYNRSNLLKSHWKEVVAGEESQSDF